MPTLIEIFCPGEAVPAADIQAFLHEGVFFAAPPSVTLAADAAAAPWTRIEIRYHARKRPVVVTCVRDELEAFRDEVAADVARVAPRERARVARCVASATHVVILEIDPATATDEAWEMADSLEGFIARSCHGVVHVSGEGFFDERLRPLSKT
ncbi:MAG: hypothetical protein H6708_25535 [Kofleriaceae bacterium]|nr:hypothetical protein [Kofleriaceae bacterium]